MDRKLQNMLEIGFEAPKAVEKRQFIRSLPIQRVSNFKLLCTQAKYIRKRTWMLWGLVFVLTAFVSNTLSKESMWVLSALMPLLSMTVISESSRAENCGMAEFELSTRFNLKTIVLARLIILGAADLVLMCMASLFADGGISASAFYIFCPYMLSAVAGLFIYRKTQGSGALYLSTGVSFLIAGLEMLFNEDILKFYQNSGEGERLLIFSLLTAALVREGYKRIKETEELKWSLE